MAFILFKYGLTLTTEVCLKKRPKKTQKWPKTYQNFETQIPKSFEHQLLAILGNFRQFLAIFGSNCNCNMFCFFSFFRQFFMYSSLSCNRTLIPPTQSKVPNYRTWVNIALALKRNVKKKLVYIGRARKKVHLVPLFIIGACSQYIF